jgi:hypothetical protein
MWDDYHQFAAGIYADNGLRFGQMDGSGNALIYWGGMVTENPIGDGNRGGLYMTGSIGAAIHLVAGLDLSVGRNVGVVGVTNLQNRLYLSLGDNSINARAPNSYITVCGSTDFTGGANQIFNGGGRPLYAFEYYWGSTRIGAMDMVGNIYAFQGIFVGAGNGAGQPGLGQNFAIYGGPSGRAIQFQSDGWALTWSSVDGSMVFRGNTDKWGPGRNAMFWVDGSGNVNAFGQFYGGNAISDERVKKEVAPWRRGLDVIMQLTPVSYLYNGLGGTADDGKRHVGLVAQQLESLVPEAVYPTPPQPHNAMDEEQPPDIRFPGQLSVDEKPLLFVVINALRELNDKLNKTTADLAVAIRRIVELERPPETRTIA